MTFDELLCLSNLHKDYIIEIKQRENSYNIVTDIVYIVPLQ